VLIPEKKLKTYLKSKKLKLTPERKVILEAILSFHGHFDVEELYKKLKSKGSRISIATIYRTIPLFLESGFIKEILQCREKATYEHIFGHKHHDHMLCIKCGRVIEFRDDRIEKFQNEVCKKYKFEAIEHRLGIKGYCRKCTINNKSINFNKEIL